LIYFYLTLSSLYLIFLSYLSVEERIQHKYCKESSGQDKSSNEAFTTALANRQSVITIQTQNTITQNCTFAVLFHRKNRYISAK